MSTTSHAILGLLSLRSWTTYELAKQVQRSLGWFWPRAERKLYDEPKRLVAAGLATSEQEMTGARPRTVYAVTARGRKALRRWLDEPPAPPTLEFEGMVKVFFADGGTLEQLRATLTVDRRHGRCPPRRARGEGRASTRATTCRSPNGSRSTTLGTPLPARPRAARSARGPGGPSTRPPSWRSTTDPGSWTYRHTVGFYEPEWPLRTRSQVLEAALGR